MIRYAISLPLSFLLLVATGCGTGFDATYGPSAGTQGRNSVNGFGALRQSFENAGYKSRDVRRLTQRTRDSSVIVWTPTVLKSTDAKVTRWFEKWLRGGDQTLIYVVPDSGSEAEYWVRAGQSAPPKQRMEYRRRAARKLNERIQWTVNRRNSFTNGWFVVKPKPEIFQRGGLSTQNWDLASQGNGVDRSSTILTEYVIEPYETPDPNAAAATPAAGAAFNPNGPVGPAAPYTPYNAENVTKTGVNFESIVKTESGDTIVARITSDKWDDSQIIVVAGGSLLTNYAFTNEMNVKLAGELVSQCTNDSKVLVSSSSGASLLGAANESTNNGNRKRASREPIAGFLLSSYSPIPVSEPNAGVPKASGMELLTVWPVSLVTIHAALLGFVICMMLFPIFGRARAVDRGSQSRFGDHLDAVASLMSRARGEKYAKARISEYMRRMKGETSGDWVLPDEPKDSPVKDMPVKDLPANDSPAEDPSPRTKDSSP